MIYEKDQPKKQVTDEPRHRSVRYYHSDVDPYPLHAEVTLRGVAGDSTTVDVEVTTKVLPQADRAKLEQFNEIVWKAAAAAEKFTAKP